MKKTTVLIEWLDDGTINDYVICETPVLGNGGDLQGQAKGFANVAPNFSIYELSPLAEVKTVTTTNTVVEIV